MISSNPNALWQRQLPYLVVGLSTCFYLYEFFLRVLPTVIYSELMQSYSIDAAAFGTFLACFFYAYASMQIPAGLLCDRYGPKFCLSVAVLVCALATLIGCYSDNYFLACVLRFAIGAVSACAFIAPLTLASRWFPADKQALITGLVQLMGCAGALFATKPIMYVINSLGWRSTIYWSGLVGLVITVLFVLIIKDYPDTVARTDDCKEDTSSESVLYKLYQVVKSPQNWAIGLCAFGSWAPVTVFAESFGIPYLCLLQDISKEAASAQVSWVWIAMAVASPLAGWASNYLRSRKLPIYILLALGLVASSILIVCPPVQSPLLIAFLLFCIGCASAAQPVTFGLIHDNNDEDIIATAMSFNNMVLISSAGILHPLVGLILSMLDVSHASTLAGLAAYQTAFAVVPVSVIGSLLILHFFVRETHCQKVAPDEPFIPLAGAYSS